MVKEPEKSGSRLLVVIEKTFYRIPSSRDHAAIYTLRRHETGTNTRFMSVSVISEAARAAGEGDLGEGDSAP